MTPDSEEIQGIGPDGSYDYIRQVRFCQAHVSLAGSEAELCARADEYPVKTPCEIVDATITWSR